MAELRFALADALAPVYRVEREVRPVGDCRLFVARAVAANPPVDLIVKVLPAALSLAVDARRFEREVKLLAGRLVHTALVAPHGAGRAGSFVYHTRPFVAGTTLRAWLLKNRAVPLARAVAILRDVVAGLAHAHAAGIAHGDVRPENVVLADGKTLLADAGMVDAVGRSFSAAAPGAPGAASADLCAPDYLVSGRKEATGPTTPRDDMFGVAVLVHEMLTGKPAPPQAEPLEGRVLPPWLGELLAARWADGEEALAAARPAPRISGEQPWL